MDIRIFLNCFHNQSTKGIYVHDSDFFVLNVKDRGLIITMLIDKQRGRSHTVGVNLKVKIDL